MFSLVATLKKTDLTLYYAAVDDDEYWIHVEGKRMVDAVVGRPACTKEPIVFFGSGGIEKRVDLMTRQFTLRGEFEKHTPKSLVAITQNLTSERVFTSWLPHHLRNGYPCEWASDSERIHHYLGSERDVFRRTVQKWTAKQVYDVLCTTIYASIELTVP